MKYQAMEMTAADATDDAAEAGAIRISTNHFKGAPGKAGALHRAGIRAARLHRLP